MASVSELIEILGETLAQLDVVIDDQNTRFHDHLTLHVFTQQCGIFTHIWDSCQAQPDPVSPPEHGFC
jgi:hypothetical protein